MGYYICKDCGYVYEIRPCTFPVHEYQCPYGHKIGGVNHILSKRDFRIFNDQQHLEEFCRGRNQNYINSFQSMTLEYFKKNYVDKYLLHKEKGILENFTIEDFMKDNPVRELNNITYRFLNFILYSYLLGAYILDHLTVDEMRKYLVDNLFPHSLFGIIKKNWELLDASLKKAGFENINIFINMKFNEIFELINNLKNVDAPDKLDNFEKSVDKFILDAINNKNDAEKSNNEYKEINNKLLNFNPQSMKEIIQSNYPPHIYSQIHYPDIQYYTVSKILNMKSFIDKFNSSDENKKKYALINILINKDSVLTKNAMNVKNVLSINKLTNLLLNIYSYKVSRDEAKKKKLNEEIAYIIEQFNNMGGNLIIDNADSFIGEYINPFIDSWNAIKKHSVQYKCRVLRDLEKGEKPYEMKCENLLCDFLVDDGDKEGGMFLAAAYQYLIECQNNFIDNVISKNNIQGVLNSYISQLEQKINIQDATANEIINIDDNIYELLNNLVSSNSIRNIFDNNKNEINYSNYNDIIYNYDIIEEELGKKILPGLKKFNHDTIKFVTYLYEGFRGGHSSILIDYNNKYIQRDLEEYEKDALNELLESNGGSRFYNDVFSSLQLLMNEIIKENYGQNKSLYEIIDMLPKYIQLNAKLVEFFRKQIYGGMQLFTVNTLVDVFDYFESLCWKDIKKNIPPDFVDVLPENIQKEINEYFDKNSNDENKIINKENLTAAIRKLISRSISGTRQEMEIKPDAKLKYYINKYDLWNKSIVEKDGFDNEIDEIFKSEILVGQSLDLYNLLDGDNILQDKLYKNKDKNKNELDVKEKRKKGKEKEKAKEKEEEKSNEKEDEINTDSINIEFKEENKENEESSTKENDGKDEDISDEENEEEEEEEEEDDRAREI
jgi:hypothetical protein